MEHSVRRAAQFIEMLLRFRAGRTDLAEIRDRSRNMNAVGKPIQGTLLLPLDPYVQVVVAIGNVHQTK
ncbi:hypothetical protein [Acidicapsa acidisoli]|uniref:hypothetical protein n=1 Tax=Acidicapsa acidisoli TaxID=1615681 RepID=UPI0021E0AF04|nr:hypothetical protein [Acidicapsa acidisoli]